MDTVLSIRLLFYFMKRKINVAKQPTITWYTFYDSGPLYDDFWIAKLTDELDLL